MARRRSVLLHERVLAVRAQMLQVAAALERVDDPDPECITPLASLLCNDTGQSPLYNPQIPAGELDGTLRRIHAGLESAARPMAGARDR